VEDHSFWFKHRNDCISSLVSRFVQRSRFADIGGGNGFVARRLQDDGHQVVLVEPGPDGAQMARDRGVARVICGTLGSAKPELGDLDAIGAFDVVEHIEDDAAFVKQVADALPEGGFFFSTVPTHSWMWSAADDEAGHFRRYTAENFSALLAPHFDVKFASYFFGALVLPIVAFRSLPYRLGIRAQSSEAVASREHGTENGLSTRVLSRLLQPEVDRVASLRPQSFGSSLIVAAQKRAI
jgi:SAM-dependent methyltransferase